MPLTPLTTLRVGERTSVRGSETPVLSLEDSVVFSGKSELLVTSVVLFDRGRAGMLMYADAGCRLFGFCVVLDYGLRLCDCFEIDWDCFDLL